MVPCVRRALRLLDVAVSLAVLGLLVYLLFRFDWQGTRAPENPPASPAAAP